jgi:hypothetical protein
MYFRFDFLLRRKVMRAERLAIKIIHILSVFLLFTQVTQGEERITQLRVISLSQYMHFAFAATTRLVKPLAVPTISYHCSAETCRKTMAILDNVIPSSVKKIDESDQLDGAVISVIFHKDDLARANRIYEYTANPRFKAATLDSGKCAVAQFLDGFEVKKIIISVIEDDGQRKNLGCILTELQRGTGLPSKSRYPEYSPQYASMSETKFSYALTGFGEFMAMHWSTLTKPGMTEDEVLTVLQKM